MDAAAPAPTDSASTASPSTLRVTDPTEETLAEPNFLERWAQPWVLDRRDLPFITLMVTASGVLMPFAALLFWPGQFRWWLGLVYLLVLFFGFIDRYTLMLHNSSHRTLFKPSVRILNHYIPAILGPFCGQSPYTYFGHHLGMHHPENNLAEDLSSTMRFQRDRLDHWLRYFLRFFFLCAIELPAYLWRKKRDKLARRTLVGEVGFLVLLGVLFWLNWQATLVVFAIPFFGIRFLMMAGNWGQHAFVDRERPANPYVNSITCINSRYNRRAFNDGYHIGHHVKANRHWAEMPGDFLGTIDTYAREGAIVFEGIDFFLVWLFLMLHRYDWLAARYVHLGGPKKSREEIIALLKERVRAIPV